MNRQNPAGKLLYYLIEGVLTLAGIITVIMPLALWVVPQHDDMSILVYFFVLSIGIGAFLAVLALSRLQKLLFPESSTGGEIRDLEDLRQRRIDWEREQEDKLRAGRVRQTGKGYALRDIGHMARISSLLALAFLMMFLPGWAIIEYGFGLGTRHTILVVEDDDDDRARIQRLLRRSGYKVLEARTGHQGLAVLDAAPDVDLVLTDLRLAGGMKGPEMMRRARLVAPGLKAIYTGIESDLSELQALLGKDVAVVLKPFLPAELRAEIRAAFAEK
jgi:CheY-like chemotaxis protein